MVEKYDVCLTHVKWAPCLIKHDYQDDCYVTKDANSIVREYHSGNMSRSRVAKTIDKMYGHKVQWVDGIA